MADIALIPPYKPQYFEYMARQTCQLALPELIRHNTSYTTFMYEQSLAEDLVILDNGVFEDNSVDVDTLFKYADAIRATEIVIPDIMHDKDATIRLMHEFKPYALEHRTQYNYMGVLQGENTFQYKQVCESFATQDWITTIAIPKYFFRKTFTHRTQLAQWIHETYPHRFDIHFLGMDEFARAFETQYALNRVNVRSMDTSLPFVYAACKEDLYKSQHVLKRPLGYFYNDQPFDEKYLELNILAVNGAYQG